MTSRWRQLIRRFHPEGIPWPGSALYNALSGTSIFLRHYELVAHDVAQYGARGSILDIGTGPGQLLLAMREAIPETKLVGVDISSAMVAQAQGNLERYGPNHQIKVLVAGANELPFKDEAFGGVVSTGSLHHWKDPLRALSEVYRVLKPGGYALMYDLVRHLPKAICEDVRARFGHFRLALLWIHSFEEPFLSDQEMQALGMQTDFRVEETKFTGALCCLVLKRATNDGKL